MSTFSVNCLRGSIHQGSEIFDGNSRGRQCAFMALSALLECQSCHVLAWTQETLDQILVRGDSMYLNALHHGLIPDTNTLSIANLPFSVNDNFGNDFCIHRNVYFQGPCQRNFVSESGAPFFGLHDALVNAFTISELCIFVLSGFMMGLVKCAFENNTIYHVFDSHSRDVFGFPHSQGTAVLLRFANIESVENYFFTLASHLNCDSFEIVPFIFERCFATNQNYWHLFQNDRTRPGSRPSMSTNIFHLSSPSEVPQASCDPRPSHGEQMSRKRQNAAEKSPSKKKKNKLSSISKKNYLTAFDPAKHGALHEQEWAIKSMQKFSKSISLSLSQCNICEEVWPSRSKSVVHFKCIRCSRDKSDPPKFSRLNGLVPSQPPFALQNLTQVEEMLICRALPIMSVYLKPGGQRGYTSHCINMPQNINELATRLPRLPSEISVLIVKMKGKHESYKEAIVRRRKVQGALMRLVANNPCYKNVQIDNQAIMHLPCDGVPSDLPLHLNTEKDCDLVPNDFGPLNEDDALYDENTLMSSYVAIPEQQMLERDALLDDVHKHILDWPSISDEPLSEFSTQYLATMCFPTLFPDAKGDPTNNSTIKSVPFYQRVQHLLKVAYKRNQSWFYPFASHPRFSFWAFDMIQRKRALQQTAIFLKQNPGEANLTTDDLLNMAENATFSNLTTKVFRCSAIITGTPSYWHKVKSDLKAIISHVGPPTFFFTLSAADLHWPELHSLFETRIKDSNSRRNNVINNPHLVDWLFTHRVEKFLKYWLYETLDASWHWYRFEYQGRGSIHCHGIAKLKNDPGLCSLTEKVLQSQLEPQGNVSVIDTRCLDPEAKLALETVLQYSDWLISTVNPLPPDSNLWMRPKIHPAQVRSETLDTSEKKEMDYIDLINSVQRHTRCSTSYCLKKSKDLQELHCRFHFPFSTCEKSHLKIEKVNSKDKRLKMKTTLVTKRNDSRVNNHQRLMLQSWRANCDIQIVLDYHACIEYLVKYTSKAEKKSQGLRHLLHKCVSMASSGSQSSTVFRKMMMKALGERDVSAQEVMHQLLSSKFYSSSFKVLPVSLDGSRKLKKQQSEAEVLTDESVLDVYAQRERFCSKVSDIISMNLVQFLTNFKVKSNKIEKQCDNVIPKFFPEYTSNVNGKNFHLYCKYQLIKYKPWTINLASAWEYSDETEENFVSKWFEFLSTPYGRSNFSSWKEELDNLGSYRVQTEIDNQSDDCTEALQQDEWMTFLDPKATPNEYLSRPQFNVEESRRRYTRQEIGMMPTYLRELEETNFTPCIPTVDISTLNATQLHAYNMIKNHDQDSNEDKQPLFMIIIGAAGTGKSYLIDAIRGFLGIKCAVTAPTGKAAFNVKGKTIHSLLKLPIHQRGSHNLTGANLLRLQTALDPIKYIIIDEFSLLGQTTFAWINSRCKQASGLMHVPFGGKSIILVGDPGQLPPVCDKPLYSTYSSTDMQLEAHALYLLFDKVIKLTVNQRVTSSAEGHFRELLLRLHNCESTENDWAILLSRDPSQLPNLSEFSDALRLFFQNDKVNNFNSEKLDHMEQPIVCIKACHSHEQAVSAKADEMGGLQGQIYLAVGAKVMLTANICTKFGLCNGAIGTVLDIVYDVASSPPSLPISVIVHFPDFTGPSFLPNHAVPICPITAESEIKGMKVERIQIPLRLSWAITIHKSQGLTLPKIWVDLGNSEKVPGLSYVAISRVRSLQDLALEPFPFQRLHCLKNSKNCITRLEEEHRLNTLASNMH